MTPRCCKQQGIIELKSKITFVIGGCKSGKTRFAQHLAESMPHAPRVYVATCRPEDEEMRRRVARHQAERGDRWVTEEVPVRLAEVLPRLRAEAGVILIDCLTLWVSNLMLADGTAEEVCARAGDLIRRLTPEGCPVVIVSNEVGTGIVPENALARAYRDAMGSVNQQMAVCADIVVHMVAGIPVAIKGTLAT
jgi:adenosylcobinamide kinase/adenosylcobinamide-phosphate guanylyltransferase